MESFKSKYKFGIPIDDNGNPIPHTHPILHSHRGDHARTIPGFEIFREILEGLETISKQIAKLSGDTDL